MTVNLDDYALDKPRAKMTRDKAIVDFIFEQGMLQRINHEGWRIIGVKDPETVAAHSLRAAQIALILARLEKYKDPYEVSTMVVFHDIAECRVGDLHKIASRYAKADEETVVKDQTDGLQEIGEDIRRLWFETEKKSTVAGIIAKDSDLLEMAFSAKEYAEKDYDYANNWLYNIRNLLKTDSAKKIFEEILVSNSNDWWTGLKQIKK